MDVLWNKKKWFHLVCITNVSSWGITYKDTIYGGHGQTTSYLFQFSYSRILECNDFLEYWNVS